MTTSQIDRSATAVRGRLLVTSLSLIAGGVLVQAALAGLFLSVSPSARYVHLSVGVILPFLAVVPAISAWRHALRGAVSRSFAVTVTLLLLALWVQEVLGHMPFPVSTAVHVPLGVLLFGLALHLTVAARRAVA